MILFKKLILAPLFLLSVVALLFQFSPILKSYDIVFSLSLSSFYQLLTICGLLVLVSFLFMLFSSIAADWKIVIPVSILASLATFLLGNPALALVLSFIMMASMLTSYLSLDMKLKSYLNFDPASLLGPGIRHLTTLLVLTLSVAFYLSINPIIQKQGLLIPDSIIDAGMKFVPNSGSGDNQTKEIMQQFSIPQEQLDAIKKDPTLLKKYHLDPKILNSLNKSSSVNDLAQNLVKDTLKEQLDNMVKPYISFIPIVLAVLLFFTLESLTSLLNLLVYPLIWITFFILERTGFIKFSQEMRPVKKMSV